jgi:hypothetical protein
MECVEFGRVDIQRLSDDELRDLVGGIAILGPVDGGASLEH